MVFQDKVLFRKQFFAMSLGGKLRCPECGAIVVEDMALDCSKVTYACTAQFCCWEKEIVFEKTNERGVKW